MDLHVFLQLDGKICLRTVICLKSTLDENSDSFNSTTYQSPTFFLRNSFHHYFSCFLPSDDVRVVS